MSTAGTHDQLDWAWGCDRILVATDGSAPSLAALGWAARIAEDVPAELSVVYAYDIDNDRATPTEAGASAARVAAGPLVRRPRGPRVRDALQRPPGRPPHRVARPHRPREP